MISFVLALVALWTAQPTNAAFCPNTSVPMSQRSGIPLDPGPATSQIQYSNLSSLGWEIPAGRIESNRNFGSGFTSTMCNLAVPQKCVSDLVNENTNIRNGLCEGVLKCFWPLGPFRGIGEVLIEYKCEGGKIVMWLLQYFFAGTMDTTLCRTGSIFEDDGSDECNLFWTPHSDFKLYANFGVPEEWFVEFYGRNDSKVEFRPSVIRKCGTTAQLGATGVRCDRSWLVKDGSRPIGVLYKIMLPFGGAPALRIRVHGVWGREQDASTHYVDVCFKACNVESPRPPPASPPPPPPPPPKPPATPLQYSCSHIYYKQPSHYKCWPTNLAPTKRLDTIFRCAKKCYYSPTPTLLQALSSRGNRAKNLTSNATAAYFNALLFHPSGRFWLSPKQVLKIFCTALKAGNDVDFKMVGLCPLPATCIV